jgi:hypothetical protein
MACYGNSFLVFDSTSCNLNYYNCPKYRENNWNFIIISFDWVLLKLIKVIRFHLLGVEISRHSDGISVGRSGFVTRQVQEITYLFTTSIPALRWTHLPMQRGQMALSGVRRLGCEGMKLTTDLHAV